MPRAEQRGRREFAIHAAVGATRGQIVKKLLVESFVIAIIGGALGFFIAVWVRDGLIALSPEGVSRFQEISFDLPVLSFTFLIASLTTVLFGLWPAWQTSQADVQLALKAGSQEAAMRHQPNARAIGSSSAKLRSRSRYWSRPAWC